MTIKLLANKLNGTIKIPFFFFALKINILKSNQSATVFSSDAFLFSISESVFWPYFVSFLIIPSFIRFSLICG